MKTELFSVLFFACACCFTACNQKPEIHTAKVKSPNDKLPLRLEAIESGNGWGYQIYVDNKVFINQKNVPAVSGFHSFKTKKDALKIGQLAIEKMKQGKKFPAISLEELKDAQVAID